MPKALKAIAGFVTDRWKTPSVCEACGNNFVCGAKLTGCWCSEVKLTAEDREKLRAQYRNCLCRSCLESLSSSVGIDLNHKD